MVVPRRRAKAIPISYPLKREAALSASGTFPTWPVERTMSVRGSKDGVIGRPACGWLKVTGAALELMVKRDPWLRPQASEGEAQHGPFCWIGRIGQGD